MAPATGRQRLADALGLATILLVLLDLLRPSLLLLPTITAGGDTPCHYPTAVWFHEHLLPSLRLHGWYPGASLGHPLLLYYFPFPFLLMSALAPLVGMPVAFKLGTALGVFLLPLLVYASFRLMRLAFPAPLLGAAAALVFLYVEDNPIWGGTIASTLTGEFSYTYGVGFAILFLGVLFRARADGRGPWAPAAVLALTSYAHGYAVLWAGLTATGLLLCDPGTSRRPWRTLGWLLAVAALAFALAGPALVPLLADWGWTTPFDDAWIDVTAHGILPPLLRPLLLAGALAVAATLARRARGGRAPADVSTSVFPGRPTRGSCCSASGRLSGAALASAGPGLGVIDVRFVPLAQLSLVLAGAAGLGLALARLALADVAAVGLVLVAAVHADGSSRFLRHWVDWNYSGLEAKELWPAWKELMGKLGAGPGAPRVAFEYGPVHERAGSIRMHETVPFFSGRSGIEGVYNQSSLTTHPVYYLLSELYPSSPNPFRSRTYSRFDLETALARLPLLGVDRLVAVSDKLASALDARADVRREARIPPYTLYRLTGTAPRYVEPLAFAPVRASPAGWRDQAFRWFSRKPPNRAVLVFTDDPRFDVVAADPWAPPPERPLPAGVGGDGGVRGRVDPHHDEPPGPPPPGQGLVPPALAGRGRRRPVPRLARVHADRAAPARRAARLRRSHRVRLRRPRPGRARHRPRCRLDPASPSRRGRTPASAGGEPRPAAGRSAPFALRAAPRARRRGGRAAPRSRALARRRARRARRARLPGLRGGAVGGRRGVRSPCGRAASVARSAASRAALRPRRGAPACRSRTRGGRAVHARRRGRAGAAPAAGAALGRPRPRGGGRPGGCFGLAPAAPRGVPAKRRGHAVSSRRPTRPPARDGAHGRAPPGCYTRLALRSGRNARSVSVSPTGPPGKDDMRKAAFVLGLIGCMSPATLQAEGVAIDHRTVGCVVAGQYPRLNACFAPAVQPRPRPRLLPRRGRAARLVLRRDGVRLALPRGHSPAPEEGARRAPDPVLRGRVRPVLRREPHAGGRGARGGERVRVSTRSCRWRRSSTARPSPSSRACPPASPAGAAGLGAGATAALAVGGAAVVGGGVAVAAGGSGDGSASTPTTTLPPVGVVPTTTVPTTTTTTTTLVADFNPSFKVLDGSTLVAGRHDRGQRAARAPLRHVRHRRPLPDALRGRGGRRDRDERVQLLRHLHDGFRELGRPGIGRRRSATSRTYAVRMTIQSIAPNNDPKAHRNLTVQVNSGATASHRWMLDRHAGPGRHVDQAACRQPRTRAPVPTRSTSRPPPATPRRGTTGSRSSSTRSTTPGPTQLILGPVTSGSPWPYDWTESAVNAYLGTACARFLEVQAYAQDSCGNASYSAKVQVIVNNTAHLHSGPGPGCVRRGRDHRSASWACREEPARSSRTGRRPSRARAAAPSPSGWSPGGTGSRRRSSRPDPPGRGASSSGACRASVPRAFESSRGRCVQLAGDSVTFRLQGRPGERVVVRRSAGAAPPAQGRGPLHLAHDRVGRGGGVGGLGDGPAHHQVVRAGGERRGRRRQAGLVVAGRARRPDAGGDDQEVAPAGLADRLHLVGRGHDAVRSRLLRELREAAHGLDHRPVHADLVQGLVVVAGEDGDGEEARPHGGQRAHRRLDHRPPAQAVDVHERDAQVRRARDRAGDGVRDVVELEVEEDLVAPAPRSRGRGRARRR